MLFYFKSLTTYLMDVIETLKDQIALVRFLHSVASCSSSSILFKACTFDPDYFLDPAKYKLKHFVQNTVVEFSCLKPSVVLQQSFLRTS